MVENGRTRKRKILVKSMKFARGILAEEGVTAERIVAKDIYGNFIDFQTILSGIDTSSEGKIGPSVDKMLYIKDTHMIPDQAYQAVAIEPTELLKAIAKSKSVKDVPTLKKYRGVK